MRLTGLATIAITTTLIAGCTPYEMMGVTPYQSMELMSGTGTVGRTPNGETMFNFIVPENAWSHLDENSLEKQHDWLISKWVGEQDICPDGYFVEASPEASTAGMIVYEGTCK